MGRRFFRHGELPLVLLALLSERRMNAYELMAELGRLFAPTYRPSPGSIYPAVEALEAEGLIRPIGDGSRTTYEPTTAGTEALEKRRATLAEFELRTGVRVGGRPSVDAALARFNAEVNAVAAYVEPDVLEALLEEAIALIRRRKESQQEERGGIER